MVINPAIATAVYLMLIVVVHFATKRLRLKTYGDIDEFDGRSDGNEKHR